MRQHTLCRLFVLTVAVLIPAQQMRAAVTAEQRKEIGALNRAVRSVASLVRRKKIDEAESQLKTIEERLEKLKLAANERAAAGLKRQITLQQNLIARARNGGKPPTNVVSFEKQVAPILTKRCVSCHSNNPKGGLRLDTFSGLEAGGSSGPLLVIGNPRTSRLMGRLVAPANRRMPKNAPALSVTEINTIGRCIAGGAKFDGMDKKAKIGTATTSKKPSPRPSVKIALATGKETVSFTKDIAPFMTNLCLRCHSGNNPRSGFSLATFEKLMQGGDTGRVVLPGNLDGSRLWDLAGKQDPIKMPPGQALITRTNCNNMRTWIVEGARFDGDDPKKPLRDLVPTEEEMRAAEFAKLTPEQFEDHRLKQTEDIWKRVLPKQRPRYVESSEFLIYGNVPAERLTQLSDWAESQGKALRSMFNDRDPLLWKGKLTVFAMRERFDYEEFNQVIQNRETPAEVTGHSVVTPDFSDAYIVLQDLGDDVDPQTPGMQLNLIDHLTGAYLKKGGGKLPEWVIRGTGLSMAAQIDKENAYIQGLAGITKDALESGIEKPQDLFADGTFAPSQIGAVGYSLVSYMRKAGGAAKFGRFVRRLQAGDNVTAAVKSVYRADLRALATAFLGSLRR